jgi:hypothetical protein
VFPQVVCHDTRVGGQGSFVHDHTGAGKYIKKQNDLQQHGLINIYRRHKAMDDACLNRQLGSGNYIRSHVLSERNIQRLKKGQT